MGAPGVTGIGSEINATYMECRIRASPQHGRMNVMLVPVTGKASTVAKAMLVSLMLVFTFNY